jgi:hypothetical protein
MTISSSYSPDTYAGDASTTSFAITFSFLSTAGNVKVSLKTDSTGVIAAQTGSGTDYSISGSNVVFNSAPATGETVIIELSPDFTQDSDYTENAALPAETLETDLDERCLEAQINNDLANNAVKLDASTVANMTSTVVVTSSTAANNAEKFIQFDSAGTGFQLSSDTSVIGGLSKTDGNFYVGNGTTVVAESGATARTSIGLGTGDSPTFTSLSLTGTLDVAADIVHTGDTNNKIGFTTDTQTFTTGGSTRLDITDLGLQLGGSGARVTTVLDEDTMSSNSATALATQQSIKAYVDTQITAEDLDLTSDSGTIAIDLDSETLTVAGGTGIDTSAATNTLTVAIDSTVTTLTGTQTLTNKTLTSPAIGTNILDTNGNELLLLTATTSAINELTLANAAIGNDPAITATGDDTDIGITIDGKGTGTIAIGSADSVITLDGTSISGTVIKDEDDMTSNSATHIATQQSIKAYVDAQVAAGVVFADQADQEAGTETDEAVTPSTQQFHPSAAKFWCNADVAGTINASYNVTSVTDTGTGAITVTIATDFSSTNYTIANCTENSLGGTAASTDITNVRDISAAGSLVADNVNASTYGGTDPTAWHFVGFGDQ